MYEQADGSSSGAQPRRMCIACNIAPPDNIDNPNVQLCPDCREKYIRYPFPKWLILFFAAIVLISAACYLLVPNTPRDYVLLQQATRYYNQKHYLLAERAISSLDTTFANTDAVMEKKVDIMMARGNFSGAGSIISSYFKGKNLPDDLCDKLNGYIDILYKYSTIGEKMDKAAPEGMSAEKAYSSLMALLGDPVSDPVVQANIAALDMNIGNYREAADYIQKAVSAGDIYLQLEAYPMKAGILRKLGDFKGAEAACRHALDLDLDSVEAHRQLAVLFLLQKDWKAALSEAGTAYSLDSSWTFVREALAVACQMSGDTAQRDKVIAEMKKAGEDTSSIEGLIAGTATLEDIYMK